MIRNNNKGITLDKLANMVARGFENTVTKDEFNSQISGLKIDIKAIDNRLGKVEYQMDEVYDILKRFEENDILNLQKRVQTLEKVVKSLAIQIAK